jgi:hypothetical protein
MKLFITIAVPIGNVELIGAGQRPEIREVSRNEAVVVREVVASLVML